MAIVIINIDVVMVVVLNIEVDGESCLLGAQKNVED